MALVTAGSTTPWGRSWLSTIARRAAAKSGIGIWTVILLLYAANTPEVQAGHTARLARSHPPLIESASLSWRNPSAGLDPGAAVAAKAWPLPGPMAEWLRRGLQILARRFDSGSGLHPLSRLT